MGAFVFLGPSLNIHPLTPTIRHNIGNISVQPNPRRALMIIACVTHS